MIYYHKNEIVIRDLIKSDAEIIFFLVFLGIIFSIARSFEKHTFAYTLGRKSQVSAVLQGVRHTTKFF